MRLKKILNFLAYKIKLIFDIPILLFSLNLFEKLIIFEKSI
jgi:hypothetical protein